MERLRGSDAYTIYSESLTSPFVTLKVCIYRPTRESDMPDTGEIIGFVKQSIEAVGASRAGLRIVRIPLDLHHPVWVDDPEFSPDNHIHQTELPAPGGKAQLCEFISDLMGRPLNPERPLWEIWLVSGLQGGRTAIVFKVHHALADGKTMVKLIEKGHSLSPGAEGYPDGGGDRREAVPGRSRLIGDALVDLARNYTVEFPRFYRHLKEARQKSAAIREAVENAVESWSAPFTVLNAAGEYSSERIYNYETFSLSDFKSLSRTFDCTINTLVLGVCSEALRRYLQEVDRIPSEPLITSMPIGEGGAKGLKNLLNSHIHNNSFSVAFLPLYQNIADFGERLRAIKKASQSAINQVRRSDGRRFDNFLDFLPGTFIRMINAQIIRRQEKKHSPLANLIISNVSGPRETLYALDGRLEMEQLLSTGNLMDSGHLNITVWSYVDNLAFSVYIRKNALPLPERLPDHLRDTVAEMRAQYLADKAPDTDRT